MQCDTTVRGVLMQEDQFIESVRHHARLCSQFGAEKIVRTTLETLALCLQEDLVREISAALPVTISGRLRTKERCTRLTVEGFLLRVSVRDGTNLKQATLHVQAVLHTLAEALDTRTLCSLRSDLPIGFNALFQAGSECGIDVTKRRKEQVMDMMTRDVHVVSPRATIQAAAELMRELDAGSLPVCDGDTVVGFVTDRDITIRSVATGSQSAPTTVGDIMTVGVVSCFEGQSLHTAARIMQQHRIRRLLVLNNKHQLVGIVSLGDIAVELEGIDDRITAEILERVSRHPQARRLESRTAVASPVALS
jgi:CBS domain-containing protein/uncharacterized protein (DUF2267 family)